MSRFVNLAVFRTIVAAVTALLIVGCSGGSGMVPSPPAVSVSVSKNAATVDVGTTVQLSATVANDSTNSGVSWTLSGSGALSKQTPTSVIYTGPSIPGSATVTATAAADKSKSARTVITVNPLPAITPPTQIPPVMVGQPYSLQLSVTSGTGMPPFAWSVTQGQLPKGLVLDSNTGLISGTPQSAVSGSGSVASSTLAQPSSAVSVTIGVADSSVPSQTASLQILFTVVPGASPIQITTSSLPTAGVNVAYSAAATATGGTPPYTWSASGLPNGLSIDPVTGVISGTATANGASAVSLMVRDAATPQQSASANLTLSVISRGIVAIISEDSVGNLSKGVSSVVGTTQDVVLSQDGRYAAFETAPAGLITPEAQFHEVYWHDSCLGAANCKPKTVIASATNFKNAEGSPQEGNGRSFQPTISADGNYVGFISQATNLDPQTAFTPKLSHIYIRKICNENAAPNCTPFTSLADINLGDDAELNKGIFLGQYDMAADANHIVFDTDSTNVLPTVPQGGLTYLEDTTCTAKAIPFTVCTPVITIGSLTSAGIPDPGLAGVSPVSSEQSVLMASSRFGRSSEQVFVQGTCVFGPDNLACLALTPPGPMAAPVMFDASVDNSGQPGRNDVLPPFSLSATGRFLVFASADALAPNSSPPGGSTNNIFVRDTCQEAAGLQATSASKVCGNPSTTTVSVADDLSPANSFVSITNHAISADGRLIIFTSASTNLVQGGPSKTGDVGVFIRDTCRNAPVSCQPSTVLVSVNSSGTLVSAGFEDAVISADGHYCAFTAVLPINGVITAQSAQFVLALTGF